MPFSEEDLSQLQARSAEIKKEYQKLSKSVPELIDMQELLMEELVDLQNAMSEIYGYAISYEQNPKVMNERLQKILKIATKSLGFKSHLDYGDKFEG